jgi:hypothetical protein
MSDVLADLEEFTRGKTKQNYLSERVAARGRSSS